MKVGKYGPYVQLGEQVKSSKLKVNPTKLLPSSDLDTNQTENASMAKISKGKKVKKEKVIKVKTVKPRMASIPKGKDLSSVTVEDAVLYLSIPRTLGNHPETGKTITANNGRFGPYVAHDGNFRSIKTPDDVYTIELPRALKLLAQEKKKRGFQKKK